jgi:beta-mannosidase
LLAYPDKPKPALDAVREALRPTLVSARIPRFQWQAGELFTAELVMLHDAPLPRPAVQVTAILRSGNWQQELLRWDCPDGPADSDLLGPILRWPLPEVLGDELELELLCSDPACSSLYRLATRQTVTQQQGGPRGLNV